MLLAHIGGDIGRILLAVIATLLIICVLLLLGAIERALNLKLMVYGYEVAGPSADETKALVNEVLEPIHAIMLNTQVAPTSRHVRVHFECEGSRKHHARILKGLKDSGAFESVTGLGPVLSE